MKHENLSFGLGRGTQSTVYCMDCMEGIKKYPDKYFSLAVIDPPYGIGEDGLKNHSRVGQVEATKYIPKNWDKTPMSLSYFEELMRVSAHQIIWGANHFIENIPNANASCWVVWNKERQAQDFADCELAWTSFQRGVKMFTFAWDGFRQGDMKNKEKRIHPTQKPVALYDWLIKYYYQEGIILDTHLGSQSSRIAALKAGIPFVGFELDEDYFRMGNERFDQFAKQGVLF